MKITDIRTMLLQGPLFHGMGAATGQRHVLIVRIDSDAGLYGLGQLEFFPGILDAVGYIRSCLLGRLATDIRPMYSEILYGTLPPHPPSSQYDRKEFASPFDPCLVCSPTATANGLMVWGLSGVEMALCDLVGKALKTPVYNLLGGKFRDRIPIYLDRSCPEDIADISAWRTFATESVERGFHQLKFDVEYVAADFCHDPWNRFVSSAQIGRTAERLSAVRQVVGPDVEIMLDFHRLYNVPDAIRLADALSHLDLKWIEDPTPADNPQACAEVRRASAAPICVGEMFNVEQMRLFIDHGACDIVHPDVLFCGGLHEARRIGELAEINYLPMALHGNGCGLAAIAAAHVAAATRGFLGLEYHWIETPWLGQVVRRGNRELFEDGLIILDDTPGLGVELNEDICRKYLAPGQSLL